MNFPQVIYSLRDFLFFLFMHIPDRLFPVLPRGLGARCAGVSVQKE